MNIFILDKNPIRAATMMLDKHVVKMPTESFQMISSNLHWFISQIEDSGSKIEDLYYATMYQYSSSEFSSQNPFLYFPEMIGGVEDDATYNPYEYRSNLWARMDSDVWSMILKHGNGSRMNSFNTLYHKAPLYKPVMFNHPSTQWGRTVEGAIYLWIHAYALCREYEGRYGRVHKVQTQMDQTLFLYLSYIQYLLFEREGRSVRYNELLFRLVLFSQGNIVPFNAFVNGIPRETGRYYGDQYPYWMQVDHSRIITILQDMDSYFEYMTEMPIPAINDKYYTHDTKKGLSFDEVVDVYRSYYLSAKWSFAKWTDFKANIGSNLTPRNIVIQRQPDWWPEDHILNMERQQKEKFEMYKRLAQQKVSGV